MDRNEKNTFDNLSCDGITIPGRVYRAGAFAFLKESFALNHWDAV